MKRCVILSAGEIVDDRLIAPLVQPEDFVICADGGYRHAKRLGIRPHLVVGDFDSMQAEEYAGVRHIAYPPQKDDTDTMIAIRHGLKRGYRNFLLLGCLGGRFDHSIANLAALYYLKKRGCTARIVDERNEVFLLEDEHIDLPHRAGCKLSVFSYSGKCGGVTLTGVQYPLDRYPLDNAFPLGVSNEFAADFAGITVENGTLLVILSAEGEPFPARGV